MQQNHGSQDDGFQSSIAPFPLDKPSKHSQKVNTLTILLCIVLGAFLYFAFERVILVAISKDVQSANANQYPCSQDIDKYLLRQYELRQKIKLLENSNKLLESQISKVENKVSQHRRSENSSKIFTTTSKEAVLEKQIEIKRQNQQIIRKYANFTSIPFDIDQHLFNPKLMQALKEYYSSKMAKSVSDFGCGKCQYLQKLIEFLKIDAVGYQTTIVKQAAFIKRQDLSQPFHDKLFDYVQSFEVGEHIFSEFQDNFLSNIANSARKGVIISWGVMGQEGYLHVNNRDNDYIITKFQRLGFMFNVNDTKIFRQSVGSYFIQSLMIFDKI